MSRLILAQASFADNLSLLEKLNNSFVRNKHRDMKMTKALPVIFATLILNACGGGGSGSDETVDGPLASNSELSLIHI